MWSSGSDQSPNCPLDGSIRRKCPLPSSIVSTLYLIFHLIVRPFAVRDLLLWVKSGEYRAYNHWAHPVGSCGSLAYFKAIQLHWSEVELHINKGKVVSNPPQSYGYFNYENSSDKLPYYKVTWPLNIIRAGYRRILSDCSWQLDVNLSSPIVFTMISGIIKHLILSPYGKNSQGRIFTFMLEFRS